MTTEYRSEADLPLNQESTDFLRAVVTSRRRRIQNALRKGSVSRSFYDYVNLTLDNVLAFCDDEDSYQREAQS